MSAAREFWTHDSNGNETCIAITYVGADAGVVWTAIKEARSFVIEREHQEHRYKGRFVRGWSEDDGYFYAESPDEDPGSNHRVPVCEVLGDRQAKDLGDGHGPSCAGDS